MPGGICQCQLGSGSVGRRVQPALPVVLATAEVGLQVPPVGFREVLTLDLLQQRLEVARAARRAPRFQPHFQPHRPCDWAHARLWNLADRVDAKVLARNGRLDGL